MTARVYPARMVRVVLFGVLVIAACRDRGDGKRATAASGSGTSTASAGSAAGAGGDAAAVPASWARVVGDKPAALGPALAPLRFGESIDAATLPQLGGTAYGLLGETVPRIVRHASDAEPKVLVNLEIRAAKLFAFRVELLTEKGAIPEDRCTGFARALEAKWGAAPDRVWVDRDARVRAALLDTCVLAFERFADVPAWIGPEPTAIVPVALVGKPARGLASRVGPAVKLDENVTFRDVGVGEHAHGPTTIDVYLHQGKVSGLGVEAAAAAADRAAIRDRISAAFGAKPAHDATTGYDVWPTKPPMRVLDTPAGVRVEVGTLTQ